MSTTTEDQTGEIVDQKRVDQNLWDKDEIIATLKQLEGDIEQIPPMYSAVKVR